MTSSERQRHCPATRVGMVSCAKNDGKISSIPAPGLDMPAGYGAQPCRVAAAGQHAIGGWDRITPARR